MIINSILDNDFYKFTMMHAARESYPDAKVTYKFTNRNPADTFSPQFLEKLKRRIKELENLALTENEWKWAQSVQLLPLEFWDYLRTFRYRADYVNCKLSPSGQLDLVITGPWHETILFEVPLLALISQTYFEDIPVSVDLIAYKEKTYRKGLILSENHCLFTEFGTRRRRSYEVQKAVIEAFMSLPQSGAQQSTYLGTSNVLFSKMYNTPPVGTMAHEWIMAHAGMFGVKGANTKALEVWLKVFEDKYTIALTDTYTRETFFEEFTPLLALKYSGIRQDSGDPITFIDQALQFYGSVKIDPINKKVVFSDNLTTERVLKIHKQINGRFEALYGIGTNFTNDVPESPALNMVIKLSSINGEPVYKTTDSKLKSSNPNSG